jgi:hypothetical protein
MDCCAECWQPFPDLTLAAMARLDTFLCPFTYPAELSISRGARLRRATCRERTDSRDAEARVRASSFKRGGPASLRAQFERTFGPRWGEAEEGDGERIW